MRRGLEEDSGKQTIYSGSGHNEDTKLPTQLLSGYNRDTKLNLLCRRYYINEVVAEAGGRFPAEDILDNFSRFLTQSLSCSSLRANEGGVQKELR